MTISRITILIFSAAIVNCGFARPQAGVYAYVPEKNSFLKLKSDQACSTVMGTIVRTQCDLTYESAPLSVPQVSFNFELPQTSTLAGFGYFDGARFVKCRIQAREDVHLGKQTGDGLRASAILIQRSPTVYTCELVPGHSLGPIHFRLWSVGTVHTAKRNAEIPKPSLDISLQAGSPNWRIRALTPNRIGIVSKTYTVGPIQQFESTIQKFSDGRFYVAGYIHSQLTRPPKIDIEHAYYEALDLRQGSVDVTHKVSELVRAQNFLIWADDSIFGDPCQGVQKRLRVIAKFDGVERTLTVPEDETMNLLSACPQDFPTDVVGLSQVRFVMQDPETIAFFGWANRPHAMTAYFRHRKLVSDPFRVPDGSDAARLWAHQILAQASNSTPTDRLAMSLDFGVLGSLTSMVAFEGPHATARLRSQDAILDGGY